MIPALAEKRTNLRTRSHSLDLRDICFLSVNDGEGGGNLNDNLDNYTSI